MPKSAGRKSAGKARHDPLHVELGEDAEFEKYGRVSQPGKRKKSKARDEDGDAETILDPKTSRKIFELAKDQQEELEMPEDGDAEGDVNPDDEEEWPSLSRSRNMKPRQNSDMSSDEEDGNIDEEEYAELQIDPQDMDALDTLLPPNAGERKTLADMIFERLDGTGDGDERVKVKVVKKANLMDERPDPAAGLDPKIVEVYTRVGALLKSYTSGPLPKPFKIIPSLPSWARILALTRPDQWSNQAYFAATRILVSNLKPAQCRVYLEGVLLEAVRENIRDTNGKLNVHLYNSLKKSFYKPGAAFKGLLFPLCENGCTLREAAIFASVLTKISIPMLHTAAALMRLATMDYSGPNSLFIRVLLDKKYALPYKVVDGLVFHFIRLSNTYKGSKDKGTSEKLPVLWHQSLLVFCQRYASDLTPDQKDALLDVVRVNPHPQIGPEVRRELVHSVARDEPRPVDGGGDVEMAV